MPRPDAATAGGRAAHPPGGFIAVVVAFLGGIVVATLLVSVTGTSINSTPYNLLSFAGLWSGFVGVPIYLSRTHGTGRLSTDFGLRFAGPLDVVLGAAVGAAAYGLAEAYGRVLRAVGDRANLGHEATKLSGHGLGIGFVAFGLAAAVGAPIAEEIYFRGLTQPVLQRYLGGAGGLAVTAVIFGLAHLGDNPIEVVVPLAVFGAMVGALAWRTGRLGPGIVAHMTFNGITVVALALAR